jgi:flagellar biogenesis protein FliO
VVAVLLAGSFFFAEPDDGGSSNRPVSIPRVEPTPDRVDPSVIPAVNDRPELARPELAGSALDPRVAEGARRLSPPTRRPRLLQDKGESDAEAARRAKSIPWWTTTGVGLLVVLTVIYFVGRLARRVVPGAMGVSTSAGPIHLLHRTFLTPKHAVCLIRCGDRILVVGVSGERMQTLSEIHDPQEIDYIRGQVMLTNPKSASQAFREMFSSRTQLDEVKRGLDGDAPAAAAEDEPTKPTGFVDHLSALRNQIHQWKSRTSTT